MLNKEVEEISDSGKVFGTLALANYSNEVLKSVTGCTRAFQFLPPSGPQWDLQKSYPEFTKAMKNTRNQIIPLMRNLLEHVQVNTGDFRRRDTEEKLDFLIEANDDVLERVGKCLDDAEGLFKKSEMIVVDKSKIKNSSNWAAGKKSFIVNKLQFPEEGGKEDEISQETEDNGKRRRNFIDKPQLKFKIPVDNSQTPFVPKLNFKPHSLKPLSILPEYSVSTNEEFYGHPYEVELNKWEPPPQFIQITPPTKYKPLHETTLTFVEDTKALDEMCSYLETTTEISVDLEHHSYRSFLGFSCLIQISTREKDFIIDGIKLRDELECLNNVLANPKIIKVFHGATCDIEWLQRDFGLYVVGLFDTFIAMKHLNYSQFSFQHLLDKTCGIKIDKKFQLADWRIRPLSEEMKAYAREDTHYLLYIYDLLRNELIEKGNETNNLLRAVYNQSKLICLKRYEKPVPNPGLALRKTRRNLNNRQSYAFTELYRWRDGVGRERDESTAFILPTHMLLTIAQTLPKEMNGILACCDPVPLSLHSQLPTLHRIVLKARDLPLHTEEVSETAVEKQKKLKEWMILLNSIHDFSDDLESDFNSVNDENKKEKEDSSDFTSLLIKKTSSISFGKLGSVSREKKQILNSLNASSAFERYELSNEVISAIKGTRDATEFDENLIKVVHKTILQEAEEDKPLEETTEKVETVKNLRKSIEAEFVTFTSTTKIKNPGKKRRKLLANDLVRSKMKKEEAHFDPDDMEHQSGAKAKKRKHMDRGKKFGKKGKKEEEIEGAQSSNKKRRRDDKSSERQGKNKPRSKFFLNPFRTKETSGRSVTYNK